MTLREEIRKLAEEAAQKWINFPTDTRTVESAILAGVKLALERNPSVAWLADWTGSDHPDDYDMTLQTWRAMTRELLKELNG